MLCNILDTFTHLQFVLSLRFPSSSSETFRETVREFEREFAAEDALEEMRDWAFLETVLCDSSAWRLKSCILDIRLQVLQLQRKYS